ncbi:MAG TPA: hypothetical protein VFA22_05655 [Stellaceae bacterium]|nr:hypothetical protein [Stellaceae bacterium]
MPKSCRIVLLLASLAALAVAVAGRAAAEDRVELQSRPGVTVPILFQPAASPVASVVLFPGGVGVISVTQGNFLLRVRGEFAAQGISVAVIDAPSDHSDGLPNDYRASADAAKDLAAVAAFLKSKAPVPVWLVGTSRGSISAGNGAARLGPSQVGGVVLTSSVWSRGMERVPLGSIAVPTLIVHNRDDGCRQSPPSGAEPALAALTAAPAKNLIFVGGGIAKSNPCGGLSAHGYYGIENQVVPVVIAWIKSHNRPAR